MIKVVKSITFILICSFIFSIDCYALSVCEMSDEYKKWLDIPEEERHNYLEPPYCASIYKDQYSVDENLGINDENEAEVYQIDEEELRATISQSRYNAAEQGIVTSVKNQGSTNTCWAFATNSLLETNALIEGVGTLDLSERHIEYAVTRNAYTNGTKSDGLSRTLDEGGNSFFSASYYFRGEGPLLESSMPFVSTISKISSSSMPTTKRVMDVDTYTYDFFSNYSVCSTNQINNIKARILKYGSAGASMYYNDIYLMSGKYYYFSGNLNPNHAVVIVGWDDTIATSAFKNTPSGKGAWIVKNSWGTSFGDNGYLYISYSDTKICGNSYNFSGVRLNEYDNTYNSAEFTSSYNINIGSTTNYMSARFTKKSSQTEYLDKVSIEVVAGNTYEVYISLSNNLTNKNDWQLLGSGKSNSDGIVSVKFDPITITSNYTIIVKRTGTEYFIPVMCSSSETSSKYYNMPISSGINYTSSDGVTWNDLSTLGDSVIKGCEPVIYAYTKHAKSGTASFAISSIKGSSTYVLADSEDYYKVNLTLQNILSYELFDIYIYNSSGTQVTNNFEIDNYISNGNIIIRMNESITPGLYTFRVKYGSTYKDVSFRVYDLLSSNSYNISGGYIIVSPGTLKEYSKTNFINNISINSSNGYQILDSSNRNITSSTTVIGTGMQMLVENKKYNIVLKGDVSGDGKIKSNDALMISRHLVKLSTLDSIKLKAADTSGDNSVKSNDALLISRFLVGLRNSL